MRWRIGFLVAFPALILAAGFWLGSNAPSCVPVEPTEPGECTDAECGPPPACPAYECPDGSLGGCTGRCLRDAAGACGWEIRDCPDPCAGVPQCALACPPGTHNPVDDNGCVHTCECVPDTHECTDAECGPSPACPVFECPDGSLGGCTGRCLRDAAGACGWEIRECPDPCAGIPECDLACPPGTHNPVDDNGCVHSCECVPDTHECTADECGSPPDCPVYECPDGSLGGCTDRCFRNADGRCVWEIRECPPPTDLLWYETCGDPVCRGWIPSELPLCTTQAAGAACEREGALCDLRNGCNTRLLCTTEDPRLQPGGCPISRAAFKQDIHYVSPAERQQLRDELLTFRLATYRYRAAPERQHLGFVIEDQEPSAAIDSGRDQVDLYAYTSMVVAALQAQAVELDALREEVARLRARLDAPATK